MATNRLGLTPATEAYLVGSIYRDTRTIGWGGASSQKARAQVAHLHLGLYALCLTEAAAIKKRQTIYAFKRELFRLPIPEHLPQPENLPLAT